VTIPKLNLTSDRALEVARANRLDWMNNRAALVDTWRLIAFNANSLKAGLDLTFSGDMGTIGNNPAAFNGQNGSMRVGVRFDAPFTRRLERNNYRSALITYQQQRRSLYQFQDGINLTLRALLRTLDQYDTNLEIQRRAVVIAIRRVDKTREDLNKPPAPVQPGQQVAPLGPTAANDLIFALNDLTSTQNIFMGVVLNYYENRMLLYRELGIMELDDCGMWIDKPIEDSAYLTDEQSPMPPTVPVEWLEEAGVTAHEMMDGEDAPELADPALHRGEESAMQPVSAEQKAAWAIPGRLMSWWSQPDHRSQTAAAGTPGGNTAQQASIKEDKVQVTPSRLDLFPEVRGQVAKRSSDADDRGPIEPSQVVRASAQLPLPAPGRDAAATESKSKPSTGPVLRR